MVIPGQHLKAGCLPQAAAREQAHHRDHFDNYFHKPVRELSCLNNATAMPTAIVILLEQVTAISAAEGSSAIIASDGT